MIVEGFVAAISGVLTFLLELVPKEAGGSDAFEYEPGYFAYRMPAMRWVHALFPMGAFVSAIGVLLAWWVIMTTIKVVVWALTVLHIIGGDGS